MKGLLRTVSAGLLFLFSSIAGAMPITYSFSGTCTIGCGDLGLSSGDSVDGYLVAGAGFDMDGVLYGSELTDFSFDFGDVDIAYATHTALGWYALNPDLSLNTLLGGFTFQNLFTGATTGSIGGASGWYASQSCGLFCQEGGGGPGSYQAVPEPGTLALLGAGFLGLALGRRKAGKRK